MGHISFWFMLLEDNIDAIKKNIETSIDASREVGLKINVRENYVHVALSSPECRKDNS
jgi:hypothetical protein